MGEEIIDRTQKYYNKCIPTTNHKSKQIIATRRKQHSESKSSQVVAARKEQHNKTLYLNHRNETEPNTTQQHQSQSNHHKRHRESLKITHGI